MLRGDRFIVWFLKRKFGRTGRIMLESCSLKMIACLSIANNSKARLPVADAIKKIDLVNKFSSEHESVRKS